jgi:hypothetical protein
MLFIIKNKSQFTENSEIHNMAYKPSSTHIEPDRISTENLLLSSKSLQ